jgi:CTP synthase
MYISDTYLFLKNIGEYKSKPLQTSIRELLSKGVRPDVIVARYSPEDGQHLSKEVNDKIALFSGLKSKYVWSLPDLESIYSVPKYLKETSEILPILSKFMGESLDCRMSPYFANDHACDQILRVGLVAKYARLSDAYLSLYESLKIAGVAEGVAVDIHLVDAEKLEDQDTDEWSLLESQDALIIPGGFGNRGMEGKILAAQYARENKVPFLGICLGLQMAIVEFGRHVADLQAMSREMDEDELITDPNVKFLVDYIPEQKDIHIKGGTMRLGGYDCTLEPVQSRSCLVSS